MLYNSFRVLMVICSFMGIFYMIDKEDFTYIIFPISIIIGNIYYLFELEDKEYMRRHGIEYDDWSLFYTDDYYPNEHHRSHTTTHHSSTTKQTTYNNNRFGGNNNNGYPYTRTTSIYTDPSYKVLSTRCKRNFTISVDKGEDEEETKLKS